MTRRAISRTSGTDRRADRRRPPAAPASDCQARGARSREREDAWRESTTAAAIVKTAWSASPFVSSLARRSVLRADARARRRHRRRAGSDLRSTIERVASLPSLIGTAPASPVWSPDSRRLRSCGTTSAGRLKMCGSSTPTAPDCGAHRRQRRVDARPPAATRPPALAARAAARARRGVSEVLWASPTARCSSSTAAACSASGARRRGTPEPVPRSRRRLGCLALTRRVTLAFLRDGDLWAAGTRPRRRGPTRLTTHWRAGHRPRAARHLQPRRSRSGHRRLGRRLAAVRVGARWTTHRVPRRRTAATSARCRSRRISGAETVVSELRRGYPGDENERRTLHVRRRRGREPIADSTLPEPGRRAISDFRGRPQAGCSSTTCPTRAPSAGSTSSSQARRGRGWSGTTAATRASIPPTSRAGTPTAAGSSSSPISANAISCSRSTRTLRRPRRRRSRPTTWDVAGERGAATVHRAAGEGACSSPAPGSGPYERHVYRLGRGRSRAGARSRRSPACTCRSCPRTAGASRRSGPTTSTPPSCWWATRGRAPTLTARHPSPPAEFAAQRVGAPALPGVHEPRRRLRRARAHPRAAEPRSHRAPSGDLRARRTRTPSAIGGAA